MKIRLSDGVPHAPKNMGERIREKRIEKGLTLEALGKAIGVSKATVQKYENNAIAKIGSDKIDALAAALEMSPNELRPEFYAAQEFLYKLQSSENGKSVTLDAVKYWFDSDADLLLLTYDELRPEYQARLIQMALDYLELERLKNESD